MDLSKLQWRSPIGSGPAIGILLVIVLAIGFAIMRALGTLGPQPLRPLLPLGFVLMATMPWVLLSKNGRAQIGIQHASSSRDYAWAIMSGAGMAFLCGAIGWIMFGTGPDNWYVSIATTYQQAFDTTGKTKVMLFLVFTSIALAFSPLGEEMFFRALLPRALEDKFSPGFCTHFECGAFAIVHLCHHGLFWDGPKLFLRILSGVIWMVLMFGTSHLFAFHRKSSGSVFPAVVSHMAFSLGMNAFIFLVLWESLP